MNAAPRRTQREGEARRGELVANAGHELKTPLSIILGLSGRLLSATDDASSEHRDAERIRANAYGLLKQIEDLLQAARIEDGRVGVELADCDVAALVRDAASGFQSLMEERDQRLVLRTPGRAPARVDEAKLGTVVTNLLANAVRYAPRGGVVRCSRDRAGRHAAHRGRRLGPGPSRLPGATRSSSASASSAAPRERPQAAAASGSRSSTSWSMLLGGTVDRRRRARGRRAVLRRARPRARGGGARRRAAAARRSATPKRERATIEALKLELQALDRRVGTGRRRTPVAARGPGAAARAARRTEPRRSAVYLEELLGEDYDMRRAARRRRRCGSSRARASRRCSSTSAARTARRCSPPCRSRSSRACRSSCSRATPSRRGCSSATSADDYAVKPYRRDAARPARRDRRAAAGRVGPRCGRRPLPRGLRARPDGHGARDHPTAGCSRSTPRWRACSASRATRRASSRSTA